MFQNFLVSQVEFKLNFKKSQNGNHSRTTRLIQQISGLKFVLIFYSRLGQGQRWAYGVQI